MPYILHLCSGSSISHYPLIKSLTIGRGDHNDIQIDDPTLSIEHAVVEFCGVDGYQIRDLNSTNGVLFKGKKVRVQPLKDGDVIMLGTHDMKFSDDSPKQLDKTMKIKKSWIPGLYYAQG